MVRPIPFLPFRASAPLLLLVGCVSYQPLPLDPRALLADLRAGAGAEPLPPRLPLLIETMRGRNPAVLAARASLQQAKALHEAGRTSADQWLLAATEVQRALLEVVQSARQQSLAQDRVAARCGWPPG